MPGRSSNTANFNDDYKFTGYEQDNEAGLDIYHANARGYDPVLGRFMQVDPMYMERLGLSTYNYVQNNPLLRIDPTGMLDDYIFDENGDFVEWIQNEEPDRIVQRNMTTGDDIGVYEFADPVNDPNLITSATKLVFPSGEDISQTINDSGVFSEGAKKHPINYAYVESRGQNRGERGSGKLDFMSNEVTIGGSKQGLDETLGTLYVTQNSAGNIAHNGYNYGNFLWGAAMKALGISPGLAKFGAHLDSIKNNGEFDSKDDQYSIKTGYEN